MDNELEGWICLNKYYQCACVCYLPVTDWGSCVHGYYRPGISFASIYSGGLSSLCSSISGPRRSLLVVKYLVVLYFYFGFTFLF